MATIGGLTNSTSSSMSGYGVSVKGYGGLASGLDTDSLIEGMTQGTRTKIDELLKKKTSNQWQTDVYRSISDKLVDIQSKYLDTLNPSSLNRSSFFDKSLVSLNGSNSDFLSVTGASKNLDNLKVLGVGQLAKDTNVITNSNASEQMLKTGFFDLSQFETISDLDGETLKFTYGTQNYTISFHSGREITKEVNGVKETFTTDFSTVDKTIESINKILGNTTLSGSEGGTLGDKIVLEKSDVDDILVFKCKNPTETNTVKLAGGSEKALNILGFREDSPIDVTNGLTGNRVVNETGTDGLTHNEYTWQLLAEKTIAFDYNGVTKEIKLPDKDTIKDWGKDDLTDYLQTQLNRSFGSGKITVGSTDDSGKYNLTFKTADSSSVFRIKSASDGLMGESGILGINYSTTNRLNMEATLDKSGLNGFPGFGTPDADGKYPPSDLIADDGKTLKLQINGVDIEGLTVKSTLSEIMRAVNSSDAGVKMNYLETSDRFTVTATNHGEGGEVVLGNAAGNDLASILFGAQNDNSNTGYTMNKGQDAIMVVEYEGGVKGTIKRDTNSFNLEGSTFTLKGEFGLEKNAAGEYVETDPTGKNRVTFATSVDTDKIAKAVSSMVEDYNTLIKEVYEQVSTKPDRSYGPLTDAEKAELSESEIKKLEDKGKEGILFNDSLLRSLSDKLRTVFTGAADAGTLKKLGLSVSSSYKDSGKMYFDEETFKAALMEDSDKIKDIFTRPVTTDENGKVTDSGGISVRLKSITYEFANTVGTHGSLIKKAGSSYSPLAEADNSMKKIRDDIDTQVKALKKKLQTEIDRYSKQFTNLEQLISQMNSQSSWLSQATGGA